MSEGTPQPPASLLAGLWVARASVMAMRRHRLLVTDLDNTLWDWFSAWHGSFSALLDGLVEMSGIDRTILEEQAQEVHQLRRTTEYSNLVRELPSLIEAAAPHDPAEVFDAALHAQNSARLELTKLYPGVDEGLRALKAAGVRLAAYTESGAYWTEWRIRHLNLDGVIDVLYSAPDHDLEAGITVEDLRTGHYAPSHYGLRRTEHRHVALGVLKPNAEVLGEILDAEGCHAADAVYLGDSLMKDVLMAQHAGVLDAHAAYGSAHHRPEYDLLRRVSHWSQRDIEREGSLSDRDVVPSLICRDRFTEILPAFQLQPVDAL